MRFNITAAASAVLLLQIAVADPAAQCDKNNACYSALTSNANQPSSLRKPGCASFFKSTVTPKPVTRTASVLVTTTFCPTKTSTETPKSTVTRTQTRTKTDTTTTTNTNFKTTTVTNTVRTDTTTTIVNTQTETDTSTVYVTTTLQAKRGIEAGKPAGCPTTNAGPSTLPTYASACQNTNAYSSACSCFGATHATTTIAPCQTTITVRSTKTRTVPASTITKTAPAPATTVTNTKTITQTKTDQVTNTNTKSVDTTVFTSTGTVNTETTTTTTVTATVTNTISPNSYNCSKYGYIVALTTLRQIDLATGDIELITDNLDGAGHAVNALGYNALDNFLYGIQDDGTIIKIDNAGDTTAVGNLGSYANTGACDLDGYHWVAYGGPWWKIDVRPTSGTYGQVVATGTFDAQGYDLIDWVFLPQYPGFFFAICGPSATSLLRFNSATSEIDILHTWDTSVVPQADWPFSFATAEGLIYAVTGTGNTGQIWQFNVDTFDASFFTQGPTNDGRGDGARCVLNPAT